MVFTSAPNYLDSTNWTQQTNLQPAGCNPENMQQPALFLPGGFSVVSYTDRAPLAKSFQPAEKAVKCPRCESSNTKFCYFNNYSLSQPRYFCKTCRRYWTRGGALRSVPVGGGSCQRNKKGKSTRCAKSLARPKRSTCISRSTYALPSSSFTLDSISISHLNIQPPQFSFVNSLHQITDYGGGDMGMNFGSYHLPTDLPVENSGSVSDVGLHSGGITEQWKPHQLPYLAGFETQQVYINGTNKGLCYGMEDGQLQEKAWVKREEDQHGLGVPRNDEKWSSSHGWTDLLPPT